MTQHFPLFRNGEQSFVTSFHLLFQENIYLPKDISSEHILNFVLHNHGANETFFCKSFYLWVDSQLWQGGKVHPYMYLLMSSNKSWSDLALFAIFENIHFAVDQVDCI